MTDREQRIAARHAAADKHEALGLQLAEHHDASSTTRAAAHLYLAEALRARAGQA